MSNSIAKAQDWLARAAELRGAGSLAGAAVSGPATAATPPPGFGFLPVPKGRPAIEAQKPTKTRQIRTELAGIGTRHASE